jgi:hypothetical protein
MKFKDLKAGDNVYVLHSNNDWETETIKNISSHKGFIQMAFETTDIFVNVSANESIFFDEKADVVVFTEKHNLFGKK